MISPHDELRIYLKRLCHRYLNMASMRQQIDDIAQWNAPGRYETLERGASFFYWATYGLERIVVVELSMYLSPDEDRSLIDWLQKAKTNARPLKPARYNAARSHGKREPIARDEYRRIIDGHLGQLAAQQAVVDKLKTHRDKAIAHLDKAYFNDAKAISNDHPLDAKDVKSLMALIREILKSHYSYLFGSDLDMTLHSAYTVDAVLQYTRGFMRAQEDPDLLDKGFTPGKYLSEVSDN